MYTRYNLQNGHIETKIFDLHKALCFIPSLAIYLSDEKERKGDRVEFNKKTQLLPIYGLGSLDEKESDVDIYNRHSKELVDLICKEAGVSAESVLDMDCYLYDPTVRALCPPSRPARHDRRHPRRVHLQRQDRQPFDDLLRSARLPAVAGAADRRRPHGSRPRALRPRGDRLHFARRRGEHESPHDHQPAVGRSERQPGHSQVVPAVLRSVAVSFLKRRTSRTPSTRSTATRPRAIIAASSTRAS